MSAIETAKQLSTIDEILKRHGYVHWDTASVEYDGITYTYKKDVRQLTIFIDFCFANQGGDTFARYKMFTFKHKGHKMDPPYLKVEYYPIFECNLEDLPEYEKQLIASITANPNIDGV